MLREARLTFHNSSNYSIVVTFNPREERYSKRRLNILIFTEIPLPIIVALCQHYSYHILSCNLT